MLISIGVLLVGLLGVAMVLPVATFELVETVKADRAAACAQAVREDAQVRGLLVPGSWQEIEPYPIDISPSTGAVDRRVGITNPATVGGPFVNEHRGLLFGESYALDPQFAARNSGVRPRIKDFPYNVRSATGMPLFPNVDGGTGWTSWTRMLRVTCAGLGFSQPWTGLLCTWGDDLIIPVPDGDTARPRQMLLCDNRKGDAFPRLPGDPASPTPAAVKAQNRADYTWLITISPSSENRDFVHEFPGGGGDFNPYVYSENAPLYEVSVVVFYKRNFKGPGGFASGEAPAERQVVLEFLGTGLGGGDVRLYARDPTAVDPADPTGWDFPEYLDLKENEWLVVSGFYPYWYVHNGVQYVRPIGVHKWYRIVAVGDVVIEQDEDGNGSFDNYEDYNGNLRWDAPYREVTLAGPDWNQAWSNDLDTDGNADAPHVATLLDGVIGVYTSTIQLH